MYFYLYQIISTLYYSVINSYFSNICEALRTANSNINTNTIRNPLTLTQRQDSVQEELSISENAIGTDTLIDVNTVEFTIDVDTELTTNSPVTSDTHNQNTNNIPNLSRFDNDEFDDGMNLNICYVLVNIKYCFYSKISISIVNIVSIVFLFNYYNTLQNFRIHL